VILPTRALTGPPSATR